jgi:choline-glycine betaine transporter
MKKTFTLVLFSLLITFQSLAFAESSKSIGNYIVHFNALSTETLPPTVARAYGITRSKNKGLLNISVLKKGAGFEGVEADIEVSATNLTGQFRNIPLRKIIEQSAVYYISEFSVTDRETLDFTIKVKTADNQTGNLKLRQQFFSN